MLQINKLDSDILRAVFASNGVVFGGFVRDMLAGDVPNDIDVRLEQAGDVPGFLLDLAKLGTVTITGGAKYGAVGGIKVTVTTSNFSAALEGFVGVTVDITWAPYAGCMMEADPDVDVNHLKLSRTGIGCSRELMGTKLLEILDNISKRQFVSDWGCPQARIQKMVDKGWKWLNAPKRAEESKGFAKASPPSS